MPLFSVVGRARGPGDLWLLPCGCQKGFCRCEPRIWKWEDTPGLFGWTQYNHRGLTKGTQNQRDGLKRGFEGGGSGPGAKEFWPLVEAGEDKEIASVLEAPDEVQPSWYYSSTEWDTDIKTYNSSKFVWLWIPKFVVICQSSKTLSKYHSLVFFCLRGAISVQEKF